MTTILAVDNVVVTVDIVVETVGTVGVRVDIVETVDTVEVTVDTVVVVMMVAAAHGGVAAVEDVVVKDLLPVRSGQHLRLMLTASLKCANNSSRSL